MPQPASQRTLLVGAFFGVAVLSFVAGVLTVNHSRPGTFQECMHANLSDMRTNSAVSALIGLCRSEFPTQPAS